MITVFDIYLERFAVIQRALVMSLTVSALSHQILAPSRQVFTKAPPLKLEKQESGMARTLSALLHVAQGPGGEATSYHTGVPVMTRRFQSPRSTEPGRKGDSKMKKEGLISENTWLLFILTFL